MTSTSKSDPEFPRMEHQAGGSVVLLDMMLPGLCNPCIAGLWHTPGRPPALQNSPHQPLNHKAPGSAPWVLVQFFCDLLPEVSDLVPCRCCDFHLARDAHVRVLFSVFSEGLLARGQGHLLRKTMRCACAHVHMPPSLKRHGTPWTAK